MSKADGVDGRGKRARKFRQAVADLAKDFGGEDGLSVAERELIQQAAILMVQAETMRTAVLKGDAIDSTDITRLGNSSARLLQAVAAMRGKRKPEHVAPWRRSES